MTGIKLNYTDLPIVNNIVASSSESGEDLVRRMVNSRIAALGVTNFGQAATAAADKIISELKVELTSYNVASQNFVGAITAGMEGIHAADIAGKAAIGGI